MKRLNRPKLIVALFVVTIVFFMATVITLSVLEINAHKHNYSSQFISPTCVDKGYTLYSCACGYSYKDEFVDELGHDYAEEFTVDKQPECKVAGSRSRHCTRCESKTEATAIPAKGHSFGNWEVKIEAECLKEGLEIRECRDCSALESRPINALGHEYGEWETVTEQTCETYGIELRTCSRCKAENRQINEALGHDFEYSTDVYYHEGTCGRCKKVNNSKHAFEGSVCADCGYEVHPTHGLQYELNADGASYKVTGIGTATDTDIVIFSTYNDLPVTEVGGSAFYDNDITSLVIYENVKQLKYSSFSYCASLTSVCLPDTLTDIDTTAFEFCKNLNTVTVDNANPVYHDVNGKYVVETATKTLFLSTVSEIPADGSVTSIGDYAFTDRIVDNEIVIPETITAIGKCAFQFNMYLKSIKIPSSVKCIGKFAFAGDNLENVILEDGVTSIGDNIFEFTKLNEIFIPKSVTFIGINVFRECRNLKSIVVDSQNPVYHSADNCIIETQTKTLVTCRSAEDIPTDGSVTTIGDYAFFSIRQDLISYELPESITSIGEYVFANYKKLEMIKISENLTHIGSGAFFNCKSLKTIEYSGTALQWKQIKKDMSIGHAWDYYLPYEYQIFCSDEILLKNGSLPLN